MSSITFHVVTAEGTHLLANIARDVFDGPLMPQRLRDYLADPNHILVVALSGELVVGQVMGVVHLHPCKPLELYVDELGVSPEYRRQRIAVQLMEVLLEQARARGCREVWLATEVDNIAARGLYKGMKMSHVRAMLFDRLV